MLNLKSFFSYSREIYKNTWYFKKFLSLKFVKKNKIFLNTPKYKKKIPIATAARPRGILYLKTSSSNIVVTLTSLQGKVFLTKSCGSLGFQGKKKRISKFAIQSTLSFVISKILQMGWKSIILHLEGFGKGRFLLVKLLKGFKLNVSLFRDVTKLPYNGCRQRKLRRG